MEEDIKILENLINVLNTGLCKFGENVRMNDCGYQEALENLLKRYKELEEENKELKWLLDYREVDLENSIPISVIQNIIEHIETCKNNAKDIIEEQDLTWFESKDYYRGQFMAYSDALIMLKKYSIEEREK